MQRMWKWSLVSVGALLALLLVAGPTQTAQAQSPASETEATWQAYFDELGEALVSSDETDLQMEIDQFELQLEDDDTEEEIGGSFSVTIDGNDATSGFLVWVYPTTDAAEGEIESLLSDFDSEDWSPADDPELGDDSGCYSGVQDEDGIAFCYLRSGDTIVAALSGIEGDTSDEALASSLETASAMIQVVPGALDEVEQPAV